jgi:fructokinase
MDLTCLGIILVDMFPTEVGKRLVDVQSFSPNPGGSPANVAVAAQRMGTSTAFIGKVGEDIFGEWLKKTLDDEGVSTIGMVFDPNARTSLTFIGMPDENHAEFVFYRNPGADMLLKKEDLHIVLLEESKALHIDSLSLTNPDYYLATTTAIDIVKKKGGFISFDMNYRPTMWDTPASAITAIKKIFPMCDVIKVNEEEMTLITGKSDPIHGGQMILSESGKLCLITLGEKGAYYVTKENNGYLPAFQVDTIDAIGSGDAFLGAILHKLVLYDSLDQALQKEAIEDIVRFATAAGALTSTKRGALPAIPYRKEVELFLKNHT